MSFIYKGKFMDLQEPLFHLVRSVHNCFLTENISLSHEKNKTKETPNPNQQHKTPLWVESYFLEWKTFLGKLRLKIFLSSQIFCYVSALDYWKKEEEFQTTFIHLLTERELRKCLNLRSFWKCFAVHIIKFLCYHTMRTLNEILLFILILL